MKVGKMKLVLIVTLLVAVAVFSQGCGKKDNEDYDTDVVSNQDEDGQDEDNGSDVKRVGNSEHGFVDIPSDWINFKDISEGALETQYSTADGSIIITLFANRTPVGSAEETAEVAKQNAEATNPENLQVGKGEMAGFEAFQVLTQYADGKDGFLWFFESEEGCVNSIALEGTRGELESIMALIESSFSVNE